MTNNEFKPNHTENIWFLHPRMEFDSRYIIMNHCGASGVGNRIEEIPEKIVIEEEHRKRPVTGDLSPKGLFLLCEADPLWEIPRGWYVYHIRSSLRCGIFEAKEDAMMYIAKLEQIDGFSKLKRGDIPPESDSELQKIFQEIAPLADKAYFEVMDKKDEAI